VDLAELVGSDPGNWLEGERLLIVAAIRDAAAEGLDELCWDLTWTAVTLFEAGSYLEDWGAAVAQALAACRRAANKRGEAAMIVATASWLCMQQANARALEMSLSGVRLFAQMGDQHGQALAHRLAGVCEVRIGQLDSALDRFTLARSMGHEAGDRFLEVGVLRDMANIYLARGDTSAAQKCLAEALPISREIGSARAQAFVWHMLGRTCLRQDQPSAAQSALDTALEFVVAANDRIGEAYVRLGLADVQLALEVDARPVLTQVLHAATQMGHQYLQAQVLFSIGQAEQQRGDHAAAVRSLQASTEITRRSGAVLWQARALDALAASYLATGAHDEARRTARTAAELRHDRPRRQSRPHAGPRLPAEIRKLPV